MADEKTALTVRALTELLKSAEGTRRMDNKIVVRRHTLHAAIGGAPTVDVIGAFHGFDWDDGSTFMHTAIPMTAADAAFLEEQQAARKASEDLGWVWLTVRDEKLSDAEKVRRLQMLFNKRMNRKGK